MVVLEELEQVREKFLKYTREAFLKLPPLEKPRILDVGCGSGLPAMEIAKLTDGEIIGIDIDQSCINEFEKKIKEKGLSNRVKALKLSTLEMKFPDDNFDVIWSEGVIGKYSFEEELKDWRKLLKHNGYFVLHYQIKKAAESISRLPKYGYCLMDIFKLPDSVWWVEFYKLIEEKMSAMYKKYEKNQEALGLLKQYQNEMNVVKSNPDDFDTAFFIKKKM